MHTQLLPLEKVEHTVGKYGMKSNAWNRYIPLQPLHRLDYLTQTFFDCQLFLPLSPSDQSLFFLHFSSFVFGHGQFEFHTEIVDDSETFFQFERVDVLAKEVRQRFPHRFQLGDVALQAPDLPFCDLRIAHCY